MSEIVEQRRARFELVRLACTVNALDLEAVTFV
jgi:hypothetical protein